MDKIIKWKEEIINQIKQLKYYIEKMKIYNYIGIETDDIILFLMDCSNNNHINKHKMILKSKKEVMVYKICKIFINLLIIQKQGKSSIDSIFN